MNAPAQGHPPGLTTLFFTELWERFSYYGMRAFLVLFMVAPLDAGGLGFSKGRAGLIYGLYTSTVYLLSVPGGWFADRFVGQRQAVLAGGILILCGHVSLAVPALTAFYLGLALVAAGTGLLKPNISTLVGRLYPPEDPRRDAGFTIFYMGINLGAFLAPLVCGSMLAESVTVRDFLKSRGYSAGAAWHAAFGAAAVGMAFGLLQFVLGRGRLGEAGLAPARPPGGWSLPRIWSTLAAGFVLTLGLGAGLFPLLPGEEAMGKVFDLLLPAFSLGILAWLFAAGASNARERRQLAVISLLFGSAALFWGCFEQAGSTLTLFAKEHTRCEIFGWTFGSTAFQSLNSIFVVALAPVFAALWVRLARSGREPSTTAKFGLAMILVGVGLLVLVPAAGGLREGVRVGPQWLAIVYLVHTCGELCLSPVGLSAMTRLAPPKVLGVIMGVWFMATSLGNYAAGRAVRLTEELPMDRFFLLVGIFPCVVGVLLILLAGPIRRWLDRAPA